MEQQTNQQVYDFLKAFCDEHSGVAADKRMRAVAFQVHDVLRNVTNTHKRLRASMDSLQNAIRREGNYMDENGLDATINNLGIVQGKGTDVDLLVGKYTQAVSDMHAVGRIVKALTE